MSVVLPPNPLAYEGDRTVPYINKTFPPPDGYSQAPVPTLWTDTDGQEAYVQVSPGVWVPIGGTPGQVETITGDDGLVVSPDTDQNIDILGSVVTNSTHAKALFTERSATSTLQLDLQVAAAIAATDVTKVGVAAFDNTDFTVDANGFVALIGGSNVSLSPYIVGTTGQSDYSTIQAAINAAVADGASSANPKNIYIKPGIYTENITVADGINIIGFVPAGSIDADELNSSFLNGTVTHASGTVTFTNFGFNRTAGNIYNMQAGILGLFASSISYSSNAFFVLTTAGTKNIDIESSAFNVTGTGQFASVDNSAMAAIFHSENSFYSFATATTITSTDAFFILNFNNDIVTNSFVLNSKEWILHLDDCQFSPNSGSPLVTSGANNTSGDLLIHACDVAVNDGGTFLNFSAGSGVTWQVTWSTIQSATTAWSSTISSSNAIKQGNFYMDSSSSQNTRIVFGTEVTGWRGTEWQQMQNFVQTTDATLTTIATIPVPSLGTTTIKGTITGQTATATDGTCGDFLVAARNPAGTAILVGTPLVNIMATSTGVFSCTVSGGNILIQVTGILATTINWATTYSFQSVLLNT